MPTPSKPEVVANLHCATGENPLWDPVHEGLYWTDIPAGKVHKYDYRSRKTTTHYEGPPVGGFTQAADGTLLLFRVHDIARLYPDGRVRPILEIPHDKAERFNDAIADPEGRIFAGRLAQTDEHGGLLRIDPDGTIHKLFSGCACPNGMGFSPDLSTFYFTCSTSRTIYRFDYDRATGNLTNRQILHQADESEGKPDGLTVDDSGNLWSARWGAAAVVKHAPDGTILQEIALPVSQVTSVAFGGLDMKTLFITTAGGTPGSTTNDGALFALDTQTVGRLEFRSKLLLG